MEKQRNIKILSIIALVLSVTAMTLGFAAFSTTLNISSSASVTPNSDDFKIKIYGLDRELDVDDLNEFYSHPMYTSTTKAAPQLRSGATNVISAENAIIGTNSITYNVTFSGPGDYPVSYYFVVYNDSDYDVKAYFDGAQYKKSCTALYDTSQSLVDDVCKYVVSGFSLAKEDSTDLSEEMVNPGYIIIGKGERIFLTLYLEYNYLDSSKDIGVYADGPFKVEYEGIDFTFTTAI